jgi:hypothetical protein
VLLQGDIYVFSTPVAFRRKARCAGNGLVLVKRRNAAVERHRGAQRVSLSTPMAVLQLLQRATAIRGELRLAMNIDRLTECVNITL